MPETNSESQASSSSNQSWVRALPDPEEWAGLLTGDDSLSMHSGLVVLQPGGDCGWHCTEANEEMIICLGGSGELGSEGLPRLPLAHGQYAYNPPHTRHCVFNTSDQPMRYIYIVAPTGDDGT